jgi:deoxyribodipyrimidine photolyase-related protein
MFLLLPNQLFYNIDIKKKIVLYEHPTFFTKFRYHVKKLVLHRASMKHYYDFMKQKGYDIQYIESKQSFNPQTITEMFHPCDKDIEKQFKHVEFHNSPMWLLKMEDLNDYYNKKDTLFFNTFKKWSVDRLDLKNMEKSYDEMNRNKYDLSSYPAIPTPSKSSYVYIEEAIQYVSQFKTCGHISHNFEYPISRKDAIHLLKSFINQRLEHFGKYQDSIVSNDKGNILYHSFLSSSINIGLITVDEIIRDVYNAKSININSFEAYIRQLLWREYMRYCYQYHYNMIDSNYFNNNKKLDKGWYEENYDTGIEPLNDCINKTMKSGYLHHIERLMIALNLMVLIEIKPKDMYSWFMSCFIDAYEWVMLGNVFIFSYNYKGSRKPYISSSNYILKMSDYKKGIWCNKWDELYKSFLKNKKDKLKGTIYYAQSVKL